MLGGRAGSHTRTRGQGMVEFAITLPIFLMLTLGVIELGWFVYSNHTLNNATREGARYAMVNGERSGSPANASSVQAVVDNFTGGLTGTVTVENVTFSPDPEPGSEVTVTTSYGYQPIVGMIIGSDPITLTRQSNVIVQY